MSIRQLAHQHRSSNLTHMPIMIWDYFDSKAAKYTASLVPTTNTATTFMRQYMDMPLPERKKIQSI